MSNVASENDTESPLRETARRFADQSPAWGLPRIYAGKFLEAMWSDARNRLHDSHRAEMQTLGVDVPAELEPMGDTSIQGDTVNHNYYAPPVETKPVASSSKLGTAALAAGSVALGLLTGGGGLALLQWYMNRPEPAVAQPTDPADWQLGVEVSREP